MTDNSNPMFKKTEYTSLSKPVEAVVVPAEVSPEGKQPRVGIAFVDVMVAFIVISILAGVTIPIVSHLSSL